MHLKFVGLFFVLLTRSLVVVVVYYISIAQVGERNAVGKCSHTVRTYVCVHFFVGDFLKLGICFIIHLESGIPAEWGLKSTIFTRTGISRCAIHRTHIDIYTQNNIYPPYRDVLYADGSTDSCEFCYPLPGWRMRGEGGVS